MLQNNIIREKPSEFCVVALFQEFQTLNLRGETNRHVAKVSSIIFEDLDNISSDDLNALLVVLGLLLTGTYQATLSPPGGVWQGDDTSWSKRSKASGISVLDQSEFLLFYIPTYVVFMVTFFL
ncbi:hypothetical protein J1N35_036504, partial [Gossypium stocksii]